MKIAAFGKLYELAQLLESCRRQGRVDRAALHKIVEFLMHLLVNQAHALRKASRPIGQEQELQSACYIRGTAKRPYSQRTSSSSSSLAYLGNGHPDGKTYSIEKKIVTTKDNQLTLSKL